MKEKVVLATAVVLAGLAAWAGIGQATPATGFTAAQQWKGLFDELDLHVNDMPRSQVKIKTKGLSDIYVTRNAIGPGGQSGWHTHPGPSLIIVTEGTITAYDSDDPTCTPKRYVKGQGFVDPGAGDVHVLRNETAEPAETVAVQFLPTGATRRIDMPAPANVSCPF